MSSQTDLTRPGTIVGSAAYLSPEQALGEEVGPSSDIYSLGAVLYAMATGQAPFVADNALAVAHQHVHEPPVPPSVRNPAISPAFDTVVLRALAKESQARQSSAEALRHDLLHVVEGATAPEAISPEATAVMTPPPTAAPGSSTRVLTRQGGPVAGAPIATAARRNGAAIAAVLVVLAVAAIALVLVALKGNKSPQTTTTVATTIPTTTTTFRRQIVTVPRTTLPPTTQAPTTEAPITITIFPPATTEPAPPPTT